MARVYLAYIAFSLLLISCRCFALADSVDAIKVFAVAVRGQTSIIDIIDEQDRSIIESWLRAIRQDNAIRCSLQYIRQLRDKVEKDKLISTMKNLDLVYDYAEFIIVQACSTGVVELGKQLNAASDAKVNLLEMTGSQFNIWLHGSTNLENPTEIERSFRFLAEWMLTVVGTDKRDSLEDFIAAWRNGPCREVLNGIERPGMEPFRNYVRLVEETKFDPIANLVSPSKYYIPMVQCCKFYQSDASLAKVWEKLQQRDDEIEEHVRTEASFEYTDIEALDEED